MNAPVPNVTPPVKPQPAMPVLTDADRAEMKEFARAIGQAVQPLPKEKRIHFKLKLFGLRVEVSL